MTSVQYHSPFIEQRDRAKARLTSEGMSCEEAERWLGTWQDSSNMEAERHSHDFWERGRQWASDAFRASHCLSDIEH